MREQSFEVNFYHERQQHKARLKEEALAMAAELETPQRAFMILAAMLKNPIRHRHRSSLANPVVDPSENVVGDTGRLVFHGNEIRNFDTWKPLSPPKSPGPSRPGGKRTTVPSDGWSVQVGDGELIEYDGLVIEYEIEEVKDTIEIVSKRVAELVVSGMTEHDLFIFGDQLQRFSISQDTGKYCSDVYSNGGADR